MESNFQDIRNLSTEWSLKGDKILLHLLENINKNIISKANTTLENLNSMSTELSKASVSLMNVNNKFICLGNTQFIENMVQEDDFSAIDNNIEDNIKNDIIKSSTPAHKVKEGENLNSDVSIINAVNKSLDVLEGLCEKIQISSDTDSMSNDSDNDADLSVILRPQDIYIDKPLPYIIGSKKWKDKWHLGLEECSSDESDVDNKKSIKNEDILDYSSSDESIEIKDAHETLSNKKNQMSLPIPNHSSAENQSSLTSTSTNNSTDAADSEVAKINSTQDATDIYSKQQNSLTNENTQFQNPQAAPQTLVKASDFAAELAKKLGGNIIEPNRVVSEKLSEKTSGDYQTSILHKNVSNRIPGNIFLDEPPPLDDPIQSKANLSDSIVDNDDYVSTGLFGDDPSPIYSDSYDNMFNNHGIFKSKPNKNHNQLFNDLPEDDFKNTSITKIEVKSNRTTSSLFDDVNNDDNIDIFTSKSSKAKVKDELVKNKEISKNSKISSENAKEKSLFDDSDNSDDDHLFAPTNRIKNLQPKSESKIESRGLIKNSIKTKNTGLFDDISDSDDDLFSISKIKPSSKTSVTNIKPTDIKEDNCVENKTLKSTNKTSDPAENPKAKLPTEIKSTNKTSVPTENPKAKHPIVISSNDFNDETIPKEPSNQILPNITNDKQKNTIAESLTNIENIPIKSSINISNGLFDDMPPPLEEDIKDNKETRKIFEDEDYNDIFSNSANFGKTETVTNSDIFQSKSNFQHNIFSDEPPDYNEQNDSDQDISVFMNSQSVINNSSDLNKSTKTEHKKSNMSDEDHTTIEDKDSKDEQDNLFMGSKDNNLKSNFPKQIITSGVFSDSDDDLFLNKTKETHVTKVSNKPSKIHSLFSDSDDDLFSSIPTSIDVKKKEKVLEQTEAISKIDSQNLPIVSPEKVATPSKLKNKSNIKIDDSKKVTNVEKTQQKTINKIQSSVNINVKALMPTSIPKSIKDIKNVTEQNISAHSITELENELEKSIEHEKNHPEIEPMDSMLCNNVLKERVKIKVKRRPSTRKARQEAIRKSAADIYNVADIPEHINNEKCITSLPNSPEKITENRIIEKKKESNHIFETNEYTNADDSQKSNITREINDDSVNKSKSKNNYLPQSKKNENIREKKSKGIFSDSDSDSDFFIPKENKQSTISKLPINTSKNSHNILFDESDDEDLFTTKISNHNRNAIGGKVKSSEKQIFGDDDLNIFTIQKENSNVKKNEETKNQEVKPKSTLKQNINTSTTFEDPLLNFINK